MVNSFWIVHAPAIHPAVTLLSIASPIFFLIGEIYGFLLRQIIWPWGSRRRVYCWHCTVKEVSTDTMVSVFNRSITDVPRRPENKRTQGVVRSGEDGSSRRDTFISSAMKDWWHNIKTFGRPLLTVTLFWPYTTQCVCVWEKGDWIFCPLSGQSWPLNLPMIVHELTLQRTSRRLCAHTHTLSLSSLILL